MSGDAPVQRHRIGTGEISLPATPIELVVGAFGTPFIVVVNHDRTLIVEQGAVRAQPLEVSGW